jgi:hypothetical protein
MHTTSPFTLLSQISTSTTNFTGSEAEFGKKHTVTGYTEDVSDEEWNRISGRTFFFGHQSVGNNILSGLKILKANNQKENFRIIESTKWNEIKDGAFAHALVGKNMDPISKIKSFEAFINNGLGNKVDAAFFKFCYVDIKKDTDVETLYKNYENTIRNLSKKYPKTKFLHVTVPLTVVQAGPKTWIKKIIGKPAGGYADNAQRNRFNQIMRKAYSGKGILFDIAKIESTSPDDRLCTYKHNGNVFQALAPEYASDGRHLNKHGSVRVAKGLINLLTNSIQMEYS